MCNFDVSGIIVYLHNVVALVHFEEVDSSALPGIFRQWCGYEWFFSLSCLSV